MSISTTLDATNGVAQRATAWLATPLLFAFRWYVALQFLKSGWLKVSDWDSTLYLFQEEYHVPLLPPPELPPKKPPKKPPPNPPPKPPPITVTPPPPPPPSNPVWGKGA